MAVETPPIAQRRYSVRRHHLAEHPETGELLVHVLAQLPDSARLDLPSDLFERARIELLAKRTESVTEFATSRRRIGLLRFRGAVVD